MFITKLCQKKYGVHSSVESGTDIILIKRLAKDIGLNCVTLNNIDMGIDNQCTGIYFNKLLTFFNLDRFLFFKFLAKRERKVRDWRNRVLKENVGLGKSCIRDEYIKYYVGQYDDFEVFIKNEINKNENNSVEKTEKQNG